MCLYSFYLYPLFQQNSIQNPYAPNINQPGSPNDTITVNVPVTAVTYWMVPVCRRETEKTYYVKQSESLPCLPQSGSSQCPPSYSC